MHICTYKGHTHKGHTYKGYTYRGQVKLDFKTNMSSVLSHSIIYCKVGNFAEENVVQIKDFAV